jgi:integrase
MAKIVKGEKRGRPGKWLVDWRDYAGVRRIRTFETKREAEVFYADLLKMQDVRSKPAVNVNITLTEYAGHWLDILTKAQTVKKRTLHIYRAQLRLYILPAFPADMRVRNLQHADITAWVLNLRARLSRNSTKIAFTALRALLEAARSDGLIALNPAALSREERKRFGLRKSKAEEDPKPFTREQVNVFMETARCESPRYLPIFLTLYQTGIRVGEAVGLQDDDLDMDSKRRSINVQRTVDNKTGEVGTPKSGKPRDVDMSLELLDCLRKLKVRKAEEKLKHGWNEMPRWVFCTSNATRAAAHEVRRAFNRVLKAAHLPNRFTVHCLRHTFATLHLETDQGRLLYVSRQLGHSSIAITADVYAKWLKPTDKAAADSLATDAWKAASGA